MTENGLQQSLGGRKVPTIKLDVGKILQDRERRANFQLSQEKLEAERKQISEEEEVPLFTRSTSIINKVSSLRTCLGIEEIFNDNEYGRYYYYDELAMPAKSRISDCVCENYLPPSDTRILNSQSCEVQFKLMSTTPDQNTAKQAYKRMVQTDFKVNFIDIITIFLNWGASLESLGASFIDVQIRLKAHNNKQSGKVFKHNIYFVLKYISHCSVGWNLNDVASIVFILLVSGLDKQFNDSYLISLETTKELIDRLQDNDISQLATHLTKRFEKMDIPTAIHFCIDLIPVSKNSSLLSLKSSYGLLKLMLGDKAPTEENGIWTIFNVLAEQVKQDNEHNLIHLSRVLKLVENILVKRYEKVDNQNDENFIALENSISEFLSHLKYKPFSKGYDDFLIITELCARVECYCSRMGRSRN